MGPVGAGKSLQGQLLAEKIKYDWFSLGKYLRESADQATKERLATGALFSDQEVIEIIDKEIGRSIINETILDGFPRTKIQAEWLSEQNTQGRVNIESVIMLDVAEDTIIKRLSARGRDEDKADVIKSRIKEYEEKTAPIIEWFIEKGIKVIRIDGEGTPEQISARIWEEVS